MIQRILVLFLFFGLTHGCTKQEVEKEQVQIPQSSFEPITRNEIQKVLEAKFLSTQTEQLNSNEEVKFLPKIAALVDNRINSYLTLEHVSEIPVTFSKKVHFSKKPGSEDQRQITNEYSRSFLVFTKKSSNIVNSAVMTIVSETQIEYKDVTKRRIFYKRLGADFTGIVLFHSLEGKFIIGWEYNKGKVIRSYNHERTQLSTDGISRELSDICDTYAVTQWCADCTDWYYNGIFDHTNCSASYACGVFTYQSCGNLGGSSNNTSGGAVLQGGFTPADEGAGIGRQPLCPESIVFGNVNNNYYRETNLKGLLFIDPTNEKGNKFDIYLGCTNYITYLAMNRNDNNTYYTDGLSPAQRIMEYDFARDLYDAGEIRTTVTPSGEQVWQFSYYATQVMAATIADIVAIGIVAEFGVLASSPSNTYIKTNFINYYKIALNAFMPGSTASGTTRTGVTSSNVKYGTSISPCQ